MVPTRGREQCALVRGPGGDDVAVVEVCEVADRGVDIEVGLRTVRHLGWIEEVDTTQGLGLPITPPDSHRGACIGVCEEGRGRFGELLEVPRSNRDVARQVADLVLIVLALGDVAQHGGDPDDVPRVIADRIPPRVVELGSASPLEIEPDLLVNRCSFEHPRQHGTQPVSKMIAVAELIEGAPDQLASASTHRRDEGGVDNLQVEVAVE